METQIWSLLNDVKFKGYCLGFVVDKFQRWDRNINIFLALTSSGSVAAWAIWNIYPLFWGGIIAFSQVITMIKPYFPYFKYVKELNKKCFQVDNLSIDIEQLWYQHQNETIDESVAANRYFELKKQASEIFTFGDETIFDITDKIENKANKRMEIYLQNNYGITVNTTS